MINEEKHAIVELLPKGAFLITRVNGEKVEGRFTIAVIEQFCESKKIPSYLDAISKIAVGMTVTEYAELLAMAIKESGNTNYYEVKKQDDKAVFVPNKMFAFIEDEFDGVSEDFIKLILHAVGRLGKKAKVVTAGELNNEENSGIKKNGNQDLSGMSSGSGATGQA